MHMLHVYNPWVYTHSTCSLADRPRWAQFGLKCLQSLYGVYRVYDLPCSFARKTCETMQRESKPRRKIRFISYKQNMTDKSKAEKSSFSTGNLKEG